MPIIYVVTNLFQLAIFLGLTAILFSVAAVSQMMEITIVHFVSPMTTFMLRQSCKIAMLSVNLTVQFASRAYNKMCYYDQTDLSPLDLINLEAPEIRYSRSAIPGLVEETQPLADVIYPIETEEVSEDPEMATTATAEEITIEPTEENAEEPVAESA
ncbi:uncharacterized protein LOC143266043 [Megachile rotundata]|uniref:uncharacterized protein LOC143266043 n=1 Tax=Megachile rotundata TaxID=143995 RepID=UPI003FCF5A8A